MLTTAGYTATGLQRRVSGVQQNNKVKYNIAQAFFTKLKDNLSSTETTENRLDIIYLIYYTHD